MSTVAFPFWWNIGTRVDDLSYRSSDAEFIVDAEFAEDLGVELAALEWRECMIPVQSFGLRPTLAEHLDAVCGQCADEAAVRLSAIEDWINSCDGIANALHQQPLLVIWRDGRLQVEDGWHRLACAAFTHGELHVRALGTVIHARGRVNVASS